MATSHSSNTALPPFNPVRRSLVDLLGREYVEGVCAARAYLTGGDADALIESATTPVDFFPEAFRHRLVNLLPSVGTVCCAETSATAEGATSSQFRANSKRNAAPLSGLGYLRVGEDGRLYFCLKSEHYHTPLGHAFPGYALMDRARRLGIPNATHNNTRGHVTRLVEERLACAASGVEWRNAAARAALLASDNPAALNRVLNLDTGSLAAEAALKMALGRFYAPQPDGPTPKYAGRTPVLLVIGDDDGGLKANYHGTTVLTQVMRGMWPDMGDALERSGAFLVRAVRRNRIEDLEAAFDTYERAPYKIAGLFHELVLMNYAALGLSDAFVQRMYALAAEHDAPTVVDEIQTGVWSSDVFLFREYRVKPTIVVVGKGFPGGEYAASRVIFGPGVDTLPQFGALVTNGQEELASLAYLVTLEWIQANADAIRSLGDYYRARLDNLAAKHPTLIESIEGRRHLAGIFFNDIEPAHAFVRTLQQGGLDISVQAYKSDCTPCALTKLPLIAGANAIDLVIARMEEALEAT